MTQRSVLTTQRKLTVQAPGFGVGRLNGSLLGCLRAIGDGS
ncbi:hypothetical protein SBF1_4800001 [Candidatus Desulfosporosinus infrequens]|uniref:Uncharacterized protein n=1 Tax=Candidatus Desulfosporosinus infrequens TaxID=2043169 RepID=A0A2U3LF67_9FIRM|nr:hypothetical protein SBF1_4800001 [Candidatus Desulfosporosinus infrequens]